LISRKRNENEIFQELTDLCKSPGYAHAIGFLCFRDHTIRYSGEIQVEDVSRHYSNKGLLRSEMSTLIGLLCKSEINDDLPSPLIMQEYIDRTDSLLAEIHGSMIDLSGAMHDHMLGKANGVNSTIRESVFYSAESAYIFQYIEFSKFKYTKDDDWFVRNKGFSITDMTSVVLSIDSYQNQKLEGTINSFRQNYKEAESAESIDHWTVLDAYGFTAKDIAENANLEEGIVEAVIESFVAPSNFSGFNSLDDFNPVNAYPIIKLNSKYLLFQQYSLAEALYETPFFWFCEDLEYKDKAMQHRGEFTEEFCAERLKLVFGENQVFQNIEIVDTSRNKCGEIDVLVVFGGKAIILQAKSKKLTIQARKGNDSLIKSDFKKAVQDAYDQALSCADLILDESYMLQDSSGNKLEIDRSFNQIYPFCVVSDNYPSLSFQVSIFLNQTSTKVIKPPFVMDVFFLDVLTELLQSPLYLLSYVDRRLSYSDLAFAAQELTILSHHLKNNLWLVEDYSAMFFDDGIAADLDTAMMCRRVGIPGDKTPVGILTKFKGTHFSNIINEIEYESRVEIVSFGFHLLTLSGETIECFNDGVSKLLESFKEDGKHHDFSFAGFIGDESGLTIHCNNYPEAIAMETLADHCELRKYKQKANKWFGVCINPLDGRLRFGFSKEFKWEQSIDMDNRVSHMMDPQIIKGTKVNFKTKTRKRKKIGRNEKCYCQSGKKYKKCCMGK